MNIKIIIAIILTAILIPINLNLMSHKDISTEISKDLVSEELSTVSSDECKRVIRHFAFQNQPVHIFYTFEKNKLEEFEQEQERIAEHHYINYLDDSFFKRLLEWTIKEIKKDTNSQQKEIPAKQMKRWMKSVRSTLCLDIDDFLYNNGRIPERSEYENLVKNWKTKIWGDIYKNLNWKIKILTIVSDYLFKNFDVPQLE
jgi:hypothetical protein